MCTFPLDVISNFPIFYISIHIVMITYEDTSLQKQEKKAKKEAKKEAKRKRKEENKRGQKVKETKEGQATRRLRNERIS
jgi:flagellar biosynthesis component FlhA